MTVERFIEHLERSAGMEGVTIDADDCLGLASDLKAALASSPTAADLDRDAEIARLKTLLGELVAVVRGECPSLLNEDSGGDAKLSMEIDATLTKGQVDAG